MEAKKLYLYTGSIFCSPDTVLESFKIWQLLSGFHIKISIVQQMNHFIYGEIFFVGELFGLEGKVYRYNKDLPTH